MEEEEAWISEKQQVVTVEDYGDNMASVHSLLKKHEAFGLDLNVHRQRVKEVCDLGERLVKAGNHHSPAISARCQQLQARLDALAETARRRMQRLHDNSAYLQFIWKCDVVESWMGKPKSFVFGKN